MAKKKKRKGDIVDCFRGNLRCPLFPIPFSPFRPTVLRRRRSIPEAGVARRSRATGGAPDGFTPKAFHPRGRGRAAHPGTTATANRPYPEGVGSTGNRPRDPTPSG